MPMVLLTICKSVLWVNLDLALKAAQPMTVPEQVGSLVSTLFLSLTSKRLSHELDADAPCYFVHVPCVTSNASIRPDNMPAVNAPSAILMFALSVPCAVYSTTDEYVRQMNTMSTPTVVPVALPGEMHFFLPCAGPATCFLHEAAHTALFNLATERTCLQPVSNRHCLPSVGCRHNRLQREDVASAVVRKLSMRKNGVVCRTES
jgi:hypothetical protein